MATHCKKFEKHHRIERIQECRSGLISVAIAPAFMYLRNGHIMLPKEQSTMAKIETPKISEILLEEFMRPHGISAYRLAKDIDVPVSRIQDILHDRRSITADTSIRLGLYFGVSERYFLNLQNDIDIREAKEKIKLPSFRD